MDEKRTKADKPQVGTSCEEKGLGEKICNFVADEIPWFVPAIIAIAGSIFDKVQNIGYILFALIIVSLIFRLIMKIKIFHNKQNTYGKYIIASLLSIVLIIVIVLGPGSDDSKVEGAGSTETTGSTEATDTTEPSTDQGEIYEWETIVNSKKGEIVPFGEYMQSKKAGFKNRIAWIVLERQDDKLLLLSEMCLDCKPYSMDKELCTWENSSLRSWLNRDFIEEAFSPAELSKILDSTVPADLNPDYRSISSGNDTTDKVFLLSVQEVQRYLPNAEARKAFPTDYAILQNAGTDSDIPGGPGWWWLRTSGKDNSYAADIRSGGAINYEGYNVMSKNFSVRPALWISIARE